MTQNLEIKNHPLLNIDYYRQGFNEGVSSSQGIESSSEHYDDYIAIKDVIALMQAKVKQTNLVVQTQHNTDPNILAFSNALTPILEQSTEVNSLTLSDYYAMLANLNGWIQNYAADPISASTWITNSESGYVNHSDFIADINATLSIIAAKVDKLEANYPEQIDVLHYKTAVTTFHDKVKISRDMAPLMVTDNAYGPNYLIDGDLIFNNPYNYDNNLAILDASIAQVETVVAFPNIVINDAYQSAVYLQPHLHTMRSAVEIAKNTIGDFEYEILTNIRNMKQDIENYYQDTITKYEYSTDRADDNNIHRYLQNLAENTKLMAPDSILLLFILQLERVESYGFFIQFLAEKIEKNNADIDNLNTMMNKAREASPKDNNSQAAFPSDVIDFMTELGLETPAKGASLSYDKYDKFMLILKTEIDQINNTTQVNTSRMERYQNYHNNAYDRANSLMQKYVRNRESSIADIK